MVAAAAAPSVPAGPKGGRIMGNMADLNRDMLGFVERCAREYGDVVRMRFLYVPAYFLFNPEHVEYVLASGSKNFIKGLTLRSPTVEDLPRLRYCEWVIKEALRLYPPAYAVGREAARDGEIGGYHVPAGMQVLIFQWVIHRDARWYDEPEAFRPERWGEEASARLPKFAYFPFGGGPRQCIGNSLAMMEAVLILATIARRFRLRLADERPPGLLPAMSLRPRSPMLVNLEKR